MSQVKARGSIGKSVRVRLLVVMNPGTEMAVCSRLEVDGNKGEVLIQVIHVKLDNQRQSVVIHVSP